MERILVSACLLGEPVRYHGGDAKVEHWLLKKWLDEGRLIPICPEVSGGLPTPRPAAEIVVTDGRRRVVTFSGGDVSEAFDRGARAAVRAASDRGIRMAILKDGSPSCGSRWTYDGTFSGARGDERGITATALSEAGVKVFDETELEDAAAYLAALERQT